ncbi:unnamed protein product, partial [Prorocentrum cordatum]
FLATPVGPEHSVATTAPGRPRLPPSWLCAGELLVQCPGRGVQEVATREGEEEEETEEGEQGEGGQVGSQETATPPLTLPLTCAPAAAVPAPSAPGTPGAPARAGPRISVQSTAALRGGASLGAGTPCESRQSGGATRTQLRPWFSAPCQRGAAAGAGIARRSPRPRAARGGGSRTAGSRQTSRTAPGARVQRASSDPRGTTQPARALHNARDADEMVMAE